MIPIRQMVKETLAEHGGGTPYFDALDERLTEPRVFAAVLSMVPNAANIIVVSGKWGEEFAVWYEKAVACPMPVVVLPGGLRHGASPTVLFQRYGALPEGRRVAFLDDSLYMGRTSTVVRDWVRLSGCQFLGAFVAYDGSPVRSLYRYNDAPN